MKKAIKFLKELVYLVMAITISGLILYFILGKLSALNRVDTFSGNIQKEGLSVVSPVFGSIESLPIKEGQFVKKGDTLAEVSVFGTDNQTPNIDSTVFIFNDNLMKIVSPKDAIVAKVVFTEKSILKPGVDFLVLYPIDNTGIKFVDPKNNLELSKYASFEVKNNSTNEKYQIIPSDTLPIADVTGRSRAYYATFTNSEDSKNFYNNQQVEVRAIKPAQQGAFDFTFSGIMLSFSNFIKSLKINIKI